MLQSHRAAIQHRYQQLTPRIGQPLIPDISNIITPFPGLGAKSKDRRFIFWLSQANRQCRHVPSSDYLLAASRNIDQETGFRPSPCRHTLPAQTLTAILSHQASRAYDVLDHCPRGSTRRTAQTQREHLLWSSILTGGNCLHSRRSLIAPGYNQTPQRHQTSGAVVLGDARRGILSPSDASNAPLEIISISTPVSARIAISCLLSITSCFLSS